MHAIDPAELSAFLDGELPAERAEIVRAALAQDPELRRSYEQLVLLDVDWKQRAATAMFRPSVQLETAPITGRFVKVVAILGLIVLRIGMKALPSLYGASLDALLLIFVVGCPTASCVTDADRKRTTL
jgi:anti-sigma factor RsiW